MNSEIDDHTLERWLDADRAHLPSDLKDIDALLSGTLVPAFFISKAQHGGAASTPGCWLGGQPRLPRHIDWPWVLRDGQPFYPMHFIAQFNLAQLNSDGRPAGLPEHGTLFFFASYVEDVELGNASVIYFEEDLSETPLRAPPPMPRNLGDAREMRWWSKNPIASFDHCPVRVSEYQAIDPNALLARGVPPTDPVYELACRASEAQSIKLRSNAPPPRSVRAKILDWLKGAERKPLAPLETMHRLLSADTNFATVGRADPSVQRLLTVDHDPEWGFEYASGSLAFFITAADLVEHRFSAAYAEQE